MCEILIAGSLSITGARCLGFYLQCWCIYSNFSFTYFISWFDEFISVVHKNELFKTVNSIIKPRVRNYYLNRRKICISCYLRILQVPLLMYNLLHICTYNFNIIVVPCILITLPYWLNTFVCMVDGCARAFND